jgi:glycosyltransferase involved in cell wall biosynthesis
MQIAILGSDHPYLRRMRRALARAGHIVHSEPTPQAEHTLIDGRSLIAFTGDLRHATGLVYHPDAHAKERLRLLPRVIASSQPVGDRLVEEYGVERARLRVVLPGVDAAARAPGSVAGCHLLSIGDLIPRKGHDILLQALGRLFDLDWRLTLVGSAARDPACAERLYAQAAAPALAGRVSFSGTPDDDGILEEYWQSADVFALATHWEGYGMAVADALRRGLPVAVTAGGAAAELVPAAAGVICPPGDHEGLSKALRRLIFDTKLRAEMRDAAWAVGQTLPEWSTQAQALLAALP